MKKILMTLTLLLTLISCKQQNTITKSDEKEMVKENMIENETILYDLKGNKHSLSDYKGKKVYIKFWSSWCSICLAGLEDVDKLALETKDYVILSVVAPGVKNEKKLEDFKEWFTSLEYKNLPVLADENGKFSKEIGVVGYPTSVFIDENGNVVNIRLGHMSNKDILDTLDSIK